MAESNSTVLPANQLIADNRRKALKCWALVPTENAINPAAMAMIELTLYAL
jgi:hypothetical protein